MDSTGVFFSSLSNHRETVREEQERLEKERQERERLEQQRKEAELREQQRQEQERARLQQEELTDSFFLEQQPADLPPKEAATPFGDIEPTTPPPEQPDPDLQDKTEYQKYFSSLGRKKKNAPKPEKQPEPQPEQSITFDTSSFEAGSEEQEEDLFASTPTGLTEEFGTGGIFSGQQPGEGAGRFRQKRRQGLPHQPARRFRRGWRAAAAGERAHQGGQKVQPVPPQGRAAAKGGATLLPPCFRRDSRSGRISGGERGD